MNQFFTNVNLTRLYIILGDGRVYRQNIPIRTTYSLSSTLTPNELVSLKHYYTEIPKCLRLLLRGY